MFVLETRLWQFVVHFLPTALSCMWVLPRFDSATPRVNYDGHSIRVHGVFNSIVGQSITGPLVLVSPLSPLAMRNCHANFVWRMRFYRATHQLDQRRVTALINFQDQNLWPTVVSRSIIWMFELGLTTTACTHESQLLPGHIKFGLPIIGYSG